MREIYLSAVAVELHSAREAVAARLVRMGYIPVWHQFSSTDPADCRPLLARKIRRCKAVIQLIGPAFGPEPSLHQQLGGRTSYAQYEALCAREVEQPVWHFLLDDQFPCDSSAQQSVESEQLQLTYRRRVETFATFSRPASSIAELCAHIDELKPELVRVHRRSALRRVGTFLSRLGFHRLGLNGHPPEETSRARS